MASAGQNWLQMPQRLQRLDENTGTCFLVLSFVVATALLYISSRAFGAEKQGSTGNYSPKWAKSPKDLVSLRPLVVFSKR